MTLRNSLSAVMVALLLLTVAFAGAAPAQEPGADTPAADLRAGLTSLLQEHVYLAGTATGTALSGGELDPAAAALDENSVALSEAIGGVYGADAGDAFLELWRTHIGFFVDYTVAAAGSDTAAQDAAREGLDGYRADFGAFIASANPNLPADAVAEELVPHVSSLFAAIDAQAAGDPQQFTLLREAANVMPGTAAILAGGIAAQFPEDFPGGTDSPGAELRAGLTHLLQEHVYLAGTATGTALSGGELDPAAAALDENSVALSEAIGGVYGADAGDAFLELWRTHIGFFVDYTVAAAGGDTAAQEAAREGLDGYRADFGAFIASANPNLPADAVADELVPHVSSLFAAIDAQAAGDPQQFTLLREAAQVMPGTASVLAGGIAAQFPADFAQAGDEDTAGDDAVDDDAAGDDAADDAAGDEAAAADGDPASSEGDTAATPSGGVETGAGGAATSSSWPAAAGLAGIALIGAGAVVALRSRSES